VAEVTFGNGYVVIDVQFNHDATFCFDQLANNGGGTFFIVGGPWSSTEGGAVGICPLEIEIRTKYV